MKTYALYKEYDPFSGTYTDYEELFMSERFFELFYSMEGTANNPLATLIHKYHRLGSTERWRLTEKTKQEKLKFNYLDIRPADKGLISYMPGGKEQKFTDNHKWSREGRQTMKVGRFIKQFFSQELLDYSGVTDQHLESFSSIVKGQMSGEDYTIEVVSGEEIRYSYLDNNLLRDPRISGGDASSSIHGSCMRYEKCQPWLQMYVQEDKIKMLRMVHKESGMIAARALLWDGVLYNADKDVMCPPQQINFIDRVYAFREWMIDFMFDWASTNGYVRKAHQTHTNKTDVEFPDGRREYGTMQFTLQNEYDYYPYLDTFTYMADDKHKLFNEYSSKAHRTEWELCSYDDGNAQVNDMDSENGTKCHHCDEYFDDDEIQVIEDRVVCDGCRDEHYRYVSDGHHCYYHEDDVYSCDYTGDYIHIDDAVNAMGNRGYEVTVHQDYAVLVDGEFYVRDHRDIVELRDGSYTLRDYAFECAYDGEMYHTDYSTYIEIDEVDVADCNLANYMTDHNLVFNSRNEIVRRDDDGDDDDSPRPTKKKEQEQLSDSTFKAGDYVVLLTSPHGNYTGVSMPTDYVYRLAEDFNPYRFLIDVDVNDFIRNGWVVSNSRTVDVTLRRATQEEIKAYISNGNKPCHIDEAKLTPEKLVAEARRRYPVGTTYLSAMTGDRKYVHNPIYTHDTWGNTYADGNCVNHNGKWAEIVSLPDTVSVDAPQDVLAEWKEEVQAKNLSLVDLILYIGNETSYEIYSMLPGSGSREKATLLLLEEAKRRYPTGTVVRGVGISTEVGTVNWEAMQTYAFNSPVLLEEEIYVGIHERLGDRRIALYMNGRWAEIVQVEESVLSSYVDDPDLPW